MKLLLLALSLSVTTPAFADPANCGAVMKTAIEAQAATDFSRSDLKADLLDVTDAMGTTDLYYDLPVRLNGNYFDTYTVLTGVGCQILSVELKR